MVGDHVHSKLTTAWLAQYITTATSSENTVADSNICNSSSVNTANYDSTMSESCYCDADTVYCLLEHCAVTI
eukprot:18753-Heterococcus_DN1.PRE.2